MNSGFEVFAVGVMVVFLILVGMVIGSSAIGNRLEKEAVTLGFAHYNPTNGIWEWKK